MGKRGNDQGQLSKEEYDAMESRGSGDAPTGSFARASQAQLTRRKIFKVSNKFKSAASNKDTSSSVRAPPSVSMSFGTKPPQAAAPPPPSQTPVAGASNNPFAAVKLQAPSNNPFGQVKLMAPSTTTNFTSAAAQPSSSSSSQSLAQKAQDLNKKFLEKCIGLSETQLKEDWSSVMKDYLEYKQAIETKYYKETNKSKKTSTDGGSSDPAPVTTSVPPVDPFKSASTAPPASSGGNSFGNFASSTTPKTNTVPNLFSTSSSSAAGASSSAGTSFSAGFNFTKTSAPAPAAPATALNNNNDSSDGALPDSSSDPLGKAEESDHDTVLTVGLVSYYKNVNKKPKKFLEDQALHLETHKVDKTHRMLMRDAAGKVMLNLKVFEGQTFQGKRKKNKKGQEKAYIRFLAVQDADEGLQSFILSLQPKDLDKTLEVLEKMAQK
mmetsp:Transcript_19788/g.30547  ORF Transcript_19788/g.30547 Transcript_19788/m.30547 type:complete len:437 (-) Transcript_19788:136-1446(-)